jgi:hypothetical protein
MLHDDELLHLILERIEEDGSFAVAAGRGRTIINVQVSDGEVTLTGVVGAASVDNQLRVAEDMPAGRRK